MNIFKKIWGKIFKKGEKNKTAKTPKNTFPRLMALLPSTDLGTGSDFALLWNGYRAGHYLINRDWQTVNEGAWVTDQDNDEQGMNRIALYRQAYRTLTGGTNPSGDWNSTRPNTTIPGIGTNPGEPSNGGLRQIENKLVELAVAAFGMDAGGAGDDTQVEKMFRALIIQLGQDNVEFQAFYDDLQAAGLTGALGYTFDGTNASVSAAPAPIGSQSSKLASVSGNVNFSSAWVKKFDPFIEQDRTTA
ncbi:MAG: hypothetical protein FWG99_09065 [Treponema sp.]|nr:hypothetical protein [Treponema sp.]